MSSTTWTARRCAACAPPAPAGWALVAYGVLPQALPQLVTYLLYRWEVIVRASVVVGFITAGGLGDQLRLDLSFRRWTDVALVLLAYVLLVRTVDAVSSALRRLAR